GLISSPVTESCPVAQGATQYWVAATNYAVSTLTASNTSNSPTFNCQASTSLAIVGTRWTIFLSSTFVLVHKLSVVFLQRKFLAVCCGFDYKICRFVFTLV